MKLAKVKRPRNRNVVLRNLVWALSSPLDLRVNDPAFGIMKSLAVVYRMRGTTHLEMLPDGANVAIPSSSKRK